MNGSSRPEKIATFEIDTTPRLISGSGRSVLISSASGVMSMRPSPSLSSRSVRGFSHASNDPHAQSSSFGSTIRPSVVLSTTSM